MSTIGVYDADLMQGRTIMPNLECAKIVAHARNNRDIAVLTPKLNPPPFTKFFVRKDYDDGLYPKEYFLDNVVYGGRAFSTDRYVPMTDKVEFTPADVSIYEPYMLATIKSQQALNKKIMKAIHVRMSLDGKHIDKETLALCYGEGVRNASGIILHDYHPEEIEGLLETLLDITNARTTREGKPKPLRIGNKFPINVYNAVDFKRWMQIRPIDGIMFIQYNGLIPDTTLAEAITENKMFLRQINFVIDEGCSTEEDFLENRAEKIFRQLLFCRQNYTIISLKYTEGFFKTKELIDFIELLNWYTKSRSKATHRPSNLTALYKYCKALKPKSYVSNKRTYGSLGLEEIKAIFIYIRIHNYNLFRMFYESNNAYLKGGELIDGWERDTGTNRQE